MATHLDFEAAPAVILCPIQTANGLLIRRVGKERPKTTNDRLWPIAEVRKKTSWPKMFDDKC